MKKKVSSLLLILGVILFSFLIMLLPTFFTSGVSRVSINKEINLPLILDDEKDIKFIFFGYSGCVDICTPRLEALNKIYGLLSSNMRDRVGVEFLDISMPYDKALPDSFAKSFNNDFKGLYLDNKVLREYTRAFDVFFSKSLLDDYEFDHTAHLYIVQKRSGKKMIRYIYSAYPYDEKQILEDIKELMNETSTP